MDNFYVFVLSFYFLLTANYVFALKADKHGNGNTKVSTCPEGDVECPVDRAGFDAITVLHSSIDDDRDGNLDRSESDEFIRDELKYEDGFDRHTTFHGSDDNISVKDLWQIWVHSEVYNWTTDEVIDWLESQVELPQYVDNFRSNEVEGKVLPRLAVAGQFMAKVLGITNAIDKQKLAVKAQDLVLFGPPKKQHSYVKDLMLVMSLVIAAGGCWLAYMQNKYSQTHLKKVMKDLEQLQSAEDALSDFKSKLDEAHREKDNYKEEKQYLESKMRTEIQSSKEEAEQLRTMREATEEELGRLKLAEQELEKYKRALEKAEIELQHRQSAPLGELQPWLQLTYEMENIHYEKKRDAAEKQLFQAKEMCEKIRRKRNAFLGSLRVAHTTSVDDTDHSISCARSALEGVKQDLQERSNRWKQIEKICGFSVVHNPGLDYLESLLRTPAGSISTQNLRDLVPHSVDDGDEDMPPASFFGNSGSRETVYSLHSPLGNSCKNYSFSTLSLSLPVPRRTPSPRCLTPTYSSNRGVVPQQRLHRSMSCAAAGGPAQGVWPHLMRAGMQLTMLGLNLTDQQQQQLIGVQPFPGLSEGYNNRPSANNLASTAIYPTTLPYAFRPVQSSNNNNSIDNKVASDNNKRGSDTDSTVSTISGKSEGKIQFDLGESSQQLETAQEDPRLTASSASTATMVSSNTTEDQEDGDTSSPTSVSFSKSRSVDVKSNAVRPRKLTTAQSESALSSLTGLHDKKSSRSLQSSNGANNNSRLSSKHTDSVDELLTLSESMDSLDELANAATPGKGEKVKKKKKLLSKLFNKGSKQKEL